MTYNFGPIATTDKGYTVQIDPEARYGYWEYPNGTEGGGLWFGQLDDGRIELRDYDGTSCLHMSIVRLLRDKGYVLDDSFDD